MAPDRLTRMEVLFARFNPVPNYLSLRGHKVKLAIADQVAQ
jgi:hypothetical protein